MTVAELVDFLKTQQPNLPVAYRCCSEFVLLRQDEIGTGELCEARQDGWIHDERPDKPSRTYLIFPGN